jgi:alcohol dehydrogenase (cytochrome c)
MGKMILTIFSLACFLGTATVTFAAEPGTEDPNNWPHAHIGFQGRGI